MEVLTGKDIFLASGIDPKLPARTMRMICDAVAAANRGEQALVVGANRFEVDRLSRAAEWVVMTSPLRLMAAHPIKFASVTDDPRRLLCGTRGIRVFIDHFAMESLNAIEWVNMARERS